MSRILLTGNLGYIGSVLTPLLQERAYEVRGLDTGYFVENLLEEAAAPQQQIIKDIREVTLEDVQGCLAVVHLAALSNDPLGELDPGFTEAINFAGTLRLARLAREAGVERFVFVSSQSMYGVSNTDAELEEDSSEKNPVTMYARTKWSAELALTEEVSAHLTLVRLRPSTVFGASPRLRCDIVFNNLVACAYTTGKIEIKSDGTPWRPVVHVRDLAAAIFAALEAPSSLVAGRAFNVGIPNGNFTVRDLAEAAGRCVPGSEVVFTGEHGADTRTYRVSFQRILHDLADYFKPSWTLDRGGAELVEFFQRVGFTEQHFRGRTCIRLQQLRHLLDQKKLQLDLTWTSCA